MTNDTSAIMRQSVYALPIIQTGVETQWNEARKIRDLFAQEINATLDEHGIEALLEYSQPGVFPLWISLIVWRREDDLTDSTRFRRQSFNITLDVNAYRRRPIIMTIATQVNGRDRTVKTPEVDVSDVRALTLWTLDAEPRPSIMKARRFEKFATQLLKSIGLPIKGDEDLAEYAKPSITIERGLILVGLILLVVPYGPVFGVTLLLYAGYRMRQRRVTDSVVKRPDESPRNLFLLDSWHSSIPDVRVDFQDLHDRIETRLSAFDDQIVQRWETHSTRTAYRIETQRRLTLTKGQAVVHVHIYPVADQAFVGWDGYLNWACWGESKPVSTVVRGKDQTKYRNLLVTGYVPTQFDLVEFNVLSEMVHGQITAELRTFLKEKAIEADIDFQIIRGNRDTALTVGEKKDKQQGRRRSVAAAE